jgi:chorismate dehydratase
VGSDSLRIGCVQYLNARPLIHGWPGKIIFDHPAALCAKLAAGELDVALVSSFEFLRNPTYSIVDGVSISSDGPVYSVVVAHHGDIRAIEEIELDAASATSVNLLRGLLVRLGLNPRLISGSEPMQLNRARLLIGDQAIRFRQQHPELCYWDLGEEWKKLVDRPFVYALWLIRPEVFFVKNIADRLRALRDKNLAELDQLIALEKGFDHAFCAHYYRNHLGFGFGEKEKEGLRMFKGLCAKHGLLPSPELQLTLF